jgi:hypothetical protein
MVSDGWKAKQFAITAWQHLAVANKTGIGIMNVVECSVVCEALDSSPVSSGTAFVQQAKQDNEPKRLGSRLAISTNVSLP